jgi:hypothetical protein
MLTCAGTQRDGRRCGAPPIRGDRFCLFHSPEREDEAAEARRLGGLRRKRERTVVGAYDLEGLASVPALRRLLEVVAIDTLSLDNGIARSRTLIALVATAAKLIELGEVEDRLTRLEAAVSERRDPMPVFPSTPVPHGEARA